MKKTVALTIVTFMFVIELYPQTKGQWKVSGTSPLQSGRYEDISFINPQQGWGVAGGATIIRTQDAGSSWDFIQAPAPYNVYFRSVALVSATKAFIGTLSPAYPLIVTPNSGKTFSAVSISGKKPGKVCGLFRKGQNIFGVGGYNGNATFIRSTDNGASWTGFDMTPYAVSLVDCYFFDDSTGLAIGSADGSQYSNGKSVVLRTSDRGNNWEQVYKSTRTNEWGWKLFFMNDSVGYGSIEKTTTGVYYLKTTNKGKDWSEQYFLNSFDVEGIGFFDESTGWIGGWSGPTFQTVDSGKTWNMFDMSNTMQNLNRIRKINDTLMYGAGTRIYQYSVPQLTGVEKEKDRSVVNRFTVEQNFPNPFNPNTTISFTLPEFSTVRVSIFNSVGQHVESIMDNPKPAGTYTLQWQPRADLTSGVYFYQVQTEKATMTKTMLYLK